MSWPLPGAVNYLSTGTGRPGNTRNVNSNIVGPNRGLRYIGSPIAWSFECIELPDKIYEEILFESSLNLNSDKDLTTVCGAIPEYSLKIGHLRPHAYCATSCIIFERFTSK